MTAGSPFLAEATRILGDLVACPTVSSDSNLNCVRYMADVLDGLGARVVITPDETGTKANLFATLGPDVAGGVMLSGHSDVVPVEGQDWSSDPFAITHRDGRFYGRGTCDMKGFLAAALAVAPQFAGQTLRKPLHFAFTYDEELGCFGAQALAQDMAHWQVRPEIALVGEPTEMRVIDGHKGCFEYTTHITGLEGHGSRPELGVNAVSYGARFVNRLMELQADLIANAPPDSRFTPPYTTINVGAFHGGTAHNIIAGHAQIDWEMRPVQASDAAFVKNQLARFVVEELLPEMRAICVEADIVTDIIAEVHGLMPEVDNPARDLALALTGQNDVGLVGFGTEAGLYQAAGMSVVVCGPGSIAEAHKPDEYLSEAQLLACLDMLVNLTDRLT